MNEVLIIYLWGIWDNIHALLLLSISLLLLYMAFAWTAIPDITSKDVVSSLIRLYKIPVILLVVMALVTTAMPNKNVMLLMFAAPKVIELTKQAGDSSQMEQIGNILTNSLNYLEQQSKELKEK